MESVFLYFKNPFPHKSKKINLDFHLLDLLAAKYGAIGVEDGVKMLF